MLLSPLLSHPMRPILRPVSLYLLGLVQALRRVPWLVSLPQCGGVQMTSWSGLSWPEPVSLSCQPLRPLRVSSWHPPPPGARGALLVPGHQSLLVGAWPDLLSDAVRRSPRARNHPDIRTSQEFRKNNSQTGAASSRTRWQEAAVSRQLAVGAP